MSNARQNQQRGPKVVEQTKSLPFAPAPNANLLAERNLLSAVIQSDSLDTYRDAAVAGVVAEDFYYKPHRRLWRLVAECAEAGETPGAVQVVSRAQAKLDACEVGWRYDSVKGVLDHVVGLTDSTVLPCDAETWARRVVANRVRRAAEESLAEQMRQLRLPDSDPATILYEPTQEAKVQLARLAGGASAQVATEGARGVFDGLEGKEPKATIYTGLESLDEQLDGGLHPGELALILGRTGGGKTSLARQIALMASGTQDMFTLVFTTEVSREKAWLGFTSALSGVPVRKIEKGQVDDRDAPKVHQALRNLSQMPLWVDDTQGLTTDALLSRVRAFDRRLRQDEGRGLGLLVVDYFQIFDADPHEQRDTRAAQLARLVKCLQRFARESGCAVVFLGQVKTEVLAQKRAPRLGDTAECRAAEAWSHVVLTVHRPWLDDPERDKAEAEIHVVKSRHSEPGRVLARWNGAAGRFDERGDWQPAPPPEPKGRR